MVIIEIADYRLLNRCIKLVNLFSLIDLLKHSKKTVGLLTYIHKVHVSLKSSPKLSVIFRPSIFYLSFYQFVWTYRCWIFRRHHVTPSDTTWRLKPSRDGKFDHYNHVVIMHDTRTLVVIGHMTSHMTVGKMIPIGNVFLPNKFQKSKLSIIVFKNVFVPIKNRTVSIIEI